MAGFKGRVLQINDATQEHVILILQREKLSSKMEPSAFAKTRDLQCPTRKMHGSLCPADVHGRGEAKSARNATNERKRANRKVPLLQIRLKYASNQPARGLKMPYERTRGLQRDHDTALRATAFVTKFAIS